MYGYPKEFFIGKTPEFLSAPGKNDMKKIIGFVEDAFNGKPRQYDFWDIRKNDEIFPKIVRSQNSIYMGKEVVVTFALDITELKRAEEELKNSREQLRNLAAYLQSAREQERTNIAREIHDDLGQTLTALKMDISWLGKKLPKDQETLLEKTTAMTKLTDMTIKTVKRISTELRPGLLDDLGLVAAIEWQAEEFENRTGITYKLTIDPEDIVIDEERSTTIFRIFQETLTNIARHAKATRITASLKEKADELVLKVIDNGKGITEKQVSDPKSFGLMGIRERAISWGGEVIIKGLPEEGTTVTVRIPGKN
jgi:PAS domain S-box-containing protein